MHRRKGEGNGSIERQNKNSDVNGNDVERSEGLRRGSGYVAWNSVLRCLRMNSQVSTTTIFLSAGNNLFGSMMTF